MIMNKCEALRACEELRSKFPPFPLPVLFLLFLRLPGNKLLSLQHLFPAEP